MTSLLERPAVTRAAELRLIALGDSITSGEGVGIITPPRSTWAALLAAQLGATEFCNLARAGARLAHVRSEQLPAAVALRPTIATLCVGLNDIVKTGCPPTAIAEDITALVGGLRTTGATVVVTRLHDPSKVFRLPRALAAQVISRVDLVNSAVDRVAEGDPGILVIDVGAMQHERGCWAVDRVHPSVLGQRRLAALAGERLGLTCESWSDAAGTPAGATTVAHLSWMLRSGLPWLARRLPEVGPPVGRMALVAAGGPVIRVARRVI